MKQTALAIAAVALIAVLAAILIVLIQLSRNGLTINVSGEVDLSGTTTGVTGDVQLHMSDNVNLVATGPGDRPIETNLSMAPCPVCSGRMIPTRWSLWDGEITWRCLDCGHITGANPEKAP
jgi:hypothetical protein